VQQLQLNVLSGPAKGATPFTLTITAKGNFSFAAPAALVFFNSTVCGRQFDNSTPGILYADPSFPSRFLVNATTLPLDVQKLSLPANFTLTVSFNNGSQHSPVADTFKYYFDPSVILLNVVFFPVS
jgi:hypothetical protein